MSVRGSNVSSDSRYTQTVMCEVPDTGSDVNIDKGAYSKGVK